MLNMAIHLAKTSGSVFNLTKQSMEHSERKLAQWDSWAPGCQKRAIQNWEVMPDSFWVRRNKWEKLVANKLKLSFDIGLLLVCSKYTEKIRHQFSLPFWNWAETRFVKMDSVDLTCWHGTVENTTSRAKDLWYQHQDQDHLELQWPPSPAFRQRQQLTRWARQARDWPGLPHKTHKSTSEGKSIAGEKCYYQQILLGLKRKIKVNDRQPCVWAAIYRGRCVQSVTTQPSPPS